MRVLQIAGIIFGIVFLWLCGFMTGRITSPERPRKVVYVRGKVEKADRKAKTQKPERHIFTSKRGKQYYITPAGNRVYVKPENEDE